MTVAALPSTVTYVENGVTTSFAVPFRFKAATDLIVSRIADGIETVLVLGTDYTVTGGSTDAGGTLVRSVATNGASLKIARATTRIQPMQYTNGGVFPAKSHEEALDRQMLIGQEQDAQLADVNRRALTAPVGEVISNLPIAADRAGKFIGFGADPAVPLALEGGGADPALRTDIASAQGAMLTGTADGRSLQDVLDDTIEIPIQRYFVTGTEADATLKINNWVQAGIAALATGKKVRLTSNGIPLHWSVVDLSFAGTGTLEIDFGLSVFNPVGQTGGRFTATGYDRIIIRRHAATGYTRSYHYRPVFDFAGGNYTQIDDGLFANCGAGGRVQGGMFNADGNIAIDVGQCPRPAPLDPTGAGFVASFEVFGFGLRAAFCDGGVFGSRNLFRNSLPAGGASSDVTGGAGHYSTYLCNNFTILGHSENAPGQGACHAGDWQGRDLVAQYNAGTIDKTLRGQSNTIDITGHGANQELATLFGCGKSKATASGENNRAAVLEIWDSWSCVGNLPSGREDIAALHPIEIAGLGSVGGRGAAHCINSVDSVLSVNISTARYNGVSFAGSLRCALRPSKIDNYGATNNGTASLSSGIECGTGTHGHDADQIDLTGSAVTPAGANTHGSTIFSQTNAQAIRYASLSAAGGAITFAGGAQSFKGSPYDHYGGGLSGGGASPALPGWWKVFQGPTTVTTGAVAILDVTPKGAVSDVFKVTVNGSDNGDGSRYFSDEVKITGAGTRVLDSWNAANAPVARAYARSGNTLTLAMASGTYSVRVSGEGTLSGSSYV